jgi:uncharacterized membrane protein
MQNQENAHTYATEKSLKSLISKDKSILSSDSESAQNFPLGLSNSLSICIIILILDLIFSKKITDFWPQK